MNSDNLPMATSDQNPYKLSMKPKPLSKSPWLSRCVLVSGGIIAVMSAHAVVDDSQINFSVPENLTYILGLTAVACGGAFIGWRRRSSR